MLNLQTANPGETSPEQSQPRDTPSCALLVISCDNYRDLWQPFFNLLWRNWPDNPFAVYLGSIRSEYPDPRVTTLTAGEDLSWSRNLRWFLEQLHTEYVLTLFDDFFLDQLIQTDALLEHLRELWRLDGTVMRLFPKPGPDTSISGSDSVGAIHPQAPYRVSAQPAFWNRQKLIDMLRDDEDAWQFEWNGTERSRSHSGFYATYRPVLPYRHVVERGRWFWKAARDYGKQDIGCDFRARSVMGPLVAAKKTVNRFRKDLVTSLLPVHLRRRK